MGQKVYYCQEFFSSVGNRITASTKFLPAGIRYKSNFSESKSRSPAKVCETVDCHSSYVQQLSWYVFQGTEKEVMQTVFDDAVEELIDQCSEMFENKTDNLSYYQMNFLESLADGHTERFSSATILKKYDLGSSANVTILKKALIDKDFIMIENSKVYFTDPVLKLWLKR